MELLISIVTYNSDIKVLEDVIKNLGRNKDNIISIFDNSSSQAISRLSSRNKCYYFKSPNIGFGAGHNKNVEMIYRKFKFKYILFLNPDLFINQNDIKKLLDGIKGKPMTLHSPILLNDDSSQQDFIRNYPTILNMIFRLLNISNKIFISKKSLLRRVSFVHGACFLIAYETFLTIGKFDNRFFLYCEDLDLCRTINTFGKGVYINSAVAVKHLHQRQSRKSIKLFIIHLKSFIKYYFKWGLR